MADSDVDMEPPSAPAAAATEAPDATEMKKALLVYKTNQQSASDDDDDDDDEDDDDDDDDDDEDEDEVDEEDEEERAAARRVVSLGKGAAMRAAADVDDDDEESGVRVEKDDEESVNVPSDDDLDSTATPRRMDTDDDEDRASTPGAGSGKQLPSLASKKHHHGSETDSASESSTARTVSPTPMLSSSAKAPKDAAAKDADDEEITTTSRPLQSGAAPNVKAMIAARRRTAVRKECEVCHEPRNGRRAMLCVNCKCMYHSSCYRKQFSKLIQISTGGKQWLCPECEPNAPPAAAEKEEPGTSTPRKRREEGGAATKPARSKPGAAGGNAKNAAPSKGGKDDVSGTSGFSHESELSRISDIALRSGKKISAQILEQTEEMLQVTQSLSAEIENVLGAALAQDKQESQPVIPPFTLVASSSTGALPPTPLSPSATNSSAAAHDSTNGIAALVNPASESPVGVSEKDLLLKRIHAGLFSIKNLVQQLQVTGIQFDVDLIKEIKIRPSKEEHKPATNAAARKAPSSNARVGTGGGAGAGGGSMATKTKNGASRLYSSKQIQKLEEWYQKSSRPESSEIQAMYRIINSPDYADRELQPDGISVKQIRIWFDNRRAKERLDYMRLKMKDISTTDMDADSVKKMKAAYIDEAKEVLEARVSRLRENTKGSVQIVDEADTLLLGSGEQLLPAKAAKASSATKAQGGANASSTKEGGESKSSTTNQKKRIRIDYVASVRKVVKDARDAGKNEEEIKVLRTAAIERARERLHVPYKNARQGPSKPLGKDEVSHIKLKMLKLLEEDAPAEELTDVIELLLSVVIPRDILVESALHRQLNLVLKAHKDNKELVKQTNKLLDEFNTIVEKGDSHADVADDDTKAKQAASKSDATALPPADGDSRPGTPTLAPSSPAASPESRRPRVKFSIEQLVVLEKHFHKEDTPSKKRLDKLALKLNELAALDPNSDIAQKSIDYKQIRCWFYKRRSTNQPPQALTTADIHDIGSPMPSSSSSETESDSNDEGSVSSKSSKTAKTSTPSKRKAPGSDEKAPVSKRSRKEAPGSETKPARAKKEAGASSKSKDASSKHSGRIFNVKQLATIIEEYEKNPRPSVARLEELQTILNQDDHADEHFVNPSGVTKRQIKTWFSNRRAKERLDLLKMKSMETHGSKGGKGDAASAAAKAGSSDLDSAESETEDEDREEPKKAEAGDAGARKSLFSPQKSENDDGEDSKAAARPKHEMVDDDDDDEEGDDDDEDMDDDE